MFIIGISKFIIGIIGIGIIELSKYCNLYIKINF